MISDGGRLVSGMCLYRNNIIAFPTHVHTCALVVLYGYADALM